jgi:hypothetical protein
MHIRNFDKKLKCLPPERLLLLRKHFSLLLRLANTIENVTCCNDWHS